jgi:hypothetical protein
MITIDNNFELYNPYLSICENCKYFDFVHLTCNAFPKGIPIKYLDGSSQHKTIDKEQIGEFVFKQI